VLDFSNGNRCVVLGYADKATASAEGEAGAQRMLQCGWAASSGPTSTIVREVTYDEELKELRGYPVSELATLRGASLLKTTAPTTLTAGGEAIAVAGA
jgi:hypothetical protein